LRADGGDVELAREVAMHIAASKPICVSDAEVPAEVLEKEKNILMAEAADSGKPPEIIEKMVGGRIKKYLAEITFAMKWVKASRKKKRTLLKKLWHRSRKPSPKG